MYKVLIKTTQPWQVRGNYIESNGWNLVSSCKTQVEAEKEVSWIEMDFFDYGSVKGKVAEVEFKIEQEEQLVWSGQKTYQ